MSAEMQPQPEQERSTLSEKAEEVLRALVGKVTKREQKIASTLTEAGGDAGVIWPSRRYEVRDKLNAVGQ